MSDEFTVGSSDQASSRRPAMQDRGYMGAWSDVRKTGVNKVLDASTDPTHSNWLYQLDLGDLTKVVWGRIVDAVAYAGTYKVQLEASYPAMPCVASVQTGLQPMGAHQLNAIPIGSAVYVLLHPQVTYGIIIGVDPEFMTSGNRAMVDFISQSSRAGLSVDICHKTPLMMKMNGMIQDTSCGRPFDVTLNGEAGWITETGLALTIDSFMAQLRVDETTGFFAFYHDQLARFTGHNLQMWSAGHEREDIDDEGEFSSIQGWTPYFWESLGSFAPYTPASRTVDAADWQQNPDQQAYSGTEPLTDYQQGWYRLRDFYGYLGQGHKRIVQLPPTTPPDTMETHTQALFPGVYHETLGLTGRKSFETAHEFIIQKRIHIPSVKQIALPPDASGDTSADYKAAGVYGEGPTPELVGEIAIPSGPGHEGFLRAAGYLDTQSFIFNWEQLSQFHYHTKDWQTPQETELEYTGVTPLPSFSALGSQQYLPVPEAIPLMVDARYGAVKYYPNHSYWALLADGGTVWGDGFGSEIRMSGGCLDITAPADIRIIPGRDLVIMAGRDANVRAKDSIDLSATCHDVRIKAQHNLHLVSNDACSSILLDCRATNEFSDILQGEDSSFGGIMLKSKTSTVAAYAPHIHLTTGALTNAAIVIDAKKGRIRQRGQAIENFTSGPILDIFYNEGTSAIETVNEWWTSGGTICSQLRVNGHLAVNDCSFFGGTLYVKDGHIATTQAAAQNYRVPALTGTALTKTTEALDSCTDRCAETTSIGGQEQTTLNNVPVCLDAEFSFRTMAQYGTSDWLFFETRWQQLARLTGDVTLTWSETPVLFQGVQTYPYPGKEKWKDQATLRTVDLNLWTINGWSADRPDPYTSPQFASPAAVVPDTGFLIIG